MTHPPRTSAKPRRLEAPRSRADARGRKPPSLLVAFNSEWTKGARVDASLPADHNALLSYQLTVLNRDNGKSLTVGVYPRGPNLRDRFTLRMLLIRALITWATCATWANPAGSGSKLVLRKYEL